MREIKFRAWDKDSNKMIYLDLGSENPHISRLHIAWFSDRIRDKRAELMQFTGLHDKNGKEIWEGDIVKHKNGIKKVYWESGSASFQMDLSNSVLDQEMGNYEDVEVIGNIYENPDLVHQ